MPTKSVMIAKKQAKEEQAKWDALKAIMVDQWQRLNRLYYIVNKDGQLVRFKPNWAQAELYKGLHCNNIVLKARQLGFSTMVGILYLDYCLFKPNYSAGIIAHTRDDAQRLFKRIKIAYEHLPPIIKQHRTIVKDSATEIEFSNGSTIVVDTSMRSSTLQMLHVSEFGYICAHYPDKAKEIVTGSLNAVGQGNLTIIESTAEGSGGAFYEMWQQACKSQAEQLRLTSMDYKPFFFPWYQDPGYILAENIEPKKDMADYFRKLESQDINLSGAQIAWYCKKYETLGDSIYQEYPSTADEAFRGSASGLIYGKAMVECRLSNRIGSVPYDPAALVHTAWDLGGAGGGDYTAIIFFQICGKEIHIIDFYQETGMSMAEYIRYVKNKPYNYGEHIAPHDIGVHEFTTGVSRIVAARRLGIKFVVASKPEEKVRIIEGIDALRNVFARLWFDEKRCAELVRCLENYRKEWDERLQRWSDKPVHDWSSHACDAMRYLAVGLNKVDGHGKDSGSDVKAVRAYFGG